MTKEVFKRLSLFAQQNDIANMKENVPVGIVMLSNGKFVVRYTHDDSVIPGDFNDCVTEIHEWLKAREY